MSGLIDLFFRILMMILENMYESSGFEGESYEIIIAVD
jgi:hypothetical protein